MFCCVFLETDKKYVSYVFNISNGTLENTGFLNSAPSVKLNLNQGN